MKRKKKKKLLLFSESNIIFKYSYVEFMYALVITRSRVQYGQYFPSFSYFTDIKTKHEKRGKY